MAKEWRHKRLRRLAVLITAALGLQTIAPPAFALDCDDLNNARNTTIANEQQQIEQQQQDMSTARQETADCMTQVSNLMGQYVVSGLGLGSIGDLLNQKLSSATCNTIRQQASQALGQLSSVAGQAGVPGAVTGAVTGAAGAQVNGALSGSTPTFNPSGIISGAGSAAGQAASGALGGGTYGNAAGAVVNQGVQQTGQSTWSSLSNMLSNSK